MKCNVSPNGPTGPTTGLSPFRESFGCTFVSDTNSRFPWTCCGLQDSEFRIECAKMGLCGAGTPNARTPAGDTHSHRGTQKRNVYPNRRSPLQAPFPNAPRDCLEFGVHRKVGERGVKDPPGYWSAYHTPYNTCPIVLRLYYDCTPL
uniref:Uncharacterized protein n=1 Tax=Eutreptiella gymnastica TaxID=73025 RepID=A0A7S1ICG5_9EUGL